MADFDYLAIDTRGQEQRGHVAAADADAARAQLDAARTDLALAEADFARYRDLYAQNFIGKAELDRRQATLDGARAKNTTAPNPAQNPTWGRWLRQVEVAKPKGSKVMDKAIWTRGCPSNI